MEEMNSLDTITAELLKFIQLKNQRLYMHSLQVANYSVSIAAKLALPKSEIEQIKQDEEDALTDGYPMNRTVEVQEDVVLDGQAGTTETDG